MKDYKGSPAPVPVCWQQHRQSSILKTLETWAQELGLDDAVRLLDQTLDEENRPMQR